MLTYALKSALFLSLMYVPYMLLLRKETFFRFNRALLLLIAALSLVLPFCDFHSLSWADSPLSQHLTATVEPGLPTAATLPGGITAMPTVPQTPPAGISLWQLLSAIYAAGAMATLAAKLRQAVRLHRAIHRGVLWKDRIDGATVYCHAGNVPSFSFFNTIVISQDDYRLYADEILRHEHSHLRYRHSWDIMLATLLQMLQWFNPLAWLFADSLRDIHEFEADDAVLRSGIDMRQYQTLLIRKAAGSGSYAFANSFNHSLIKKRITMMLQKKSNPWMRSKALYVIPVTIMALSAVATSDANVQQSRYTDASDANGGKVTNFSSDRQTLAEENALPTRETAENAVPANADTVKTAPSTTLDMYGEEVMDNPEKLPEYEGGMMALMQLLMHNMQYPKIAIECGVSGRVHVQLLVHRDGSVSDMKVQKSDINEVEVRKVEGEADGMTVNAYHAKPDGGKYLSEAEYAASVKALETEALRVMGMARSWKPGEHKGKKVTTYFSIPITFRLN